MRAAVGAFTQVHEHVVYQWADVLLPLDAGAGRKEGQYFQGRCDHIDVLAARGVRKHWYERPDIRRILRRRDGDHALLDAAAHTVHGKLCEYEITWMASRGPVVRDHVRRSRS